MTIEDRVVGDAKVTVITGRIDSATASGCEQTLMKLVQDGRTSMVVDMAGVDYLSSAGIRVLVMLFKRAAAAKMPIALSNLQAHVAEVLEISGLDDVLVAYPSIEAALDAMA